MAITVFAYYSFTYYMYVTVRSAVHEYIHACICMHTYIVSYCKPQFRYIIIHCSGKV